MIYKFFIYNNFLLESLIKRQLFFAKVEAFNDPFEGIFRLSITENIKEQQKVTASYISPTKECLEQYQNKKDKLENRINRPYEFQYNNNGVCCFTNKENRFNILMWAHYTNSGKGVCIGFDEDIQFIHINDGIESIIPRARKVEVTYIPENSPPSCHPLDSDRLKPDNLLEIKSGAWGYEKEIRFICNQHGLCTFDPNKLKEIYLGYSLDESQKSTINSIVNQYGYNDLDIYEITLEKNSFKLHPNKVNKPEH